MKKEQRYVIKNLETGHYYCESKYNFCTNKKYAKQFSLAEANAKITELVEIFNCEIGSAGEEDKERIASLKEEMKEDIKEEIK